jgi:ribosomal protein S18 acetylase RimI-like enzyme
MIRFLDTVASVEQVVVAPERRREGHGRALVAALLRELRHRRVRHVSGTATSPAAIALFRDAGFTIGGHRRPVPADYAAGCMTFWWDALPDDVRYFWARLTASGAPRGPANLIALTGPSRTARLSPPMSESVAWP